MAGPDAVVHLPITSRQRIGDGLRVSARLVASGVDMSWLKAGLQKWLSAGRASVRQMGSEHLMPAGRGDAVNDQELVVKLVDATAEKLVVNDVYQDLALSVRGARWLNGLLMGGEISDCSLLDSAAAPFVGKRASGYVSRDDPELDWLRKLPTTTGARTCPYEPGRATN